MNDKKINTGIIGFGLSGKIFHAPFLHTHSGFNLKKIVERNCVESKKIYPYVEVVPDYQNLIKDKTLDLIAVCTPNMLHFYMVKEILKAGKHAIVEKPFTTTSKEADELIKIAKKKKRNIFVYQNRRWDGDFLTIKKILDGNLLGDLYEYEAYFDRYRPELSTNWRDEVNAAGVGTIALWMRPVVAILAGLIADRLSASKMIIFSFVFMLIGGVIIGSGILNQGIFWYFLITIVTISIGIYALRGLYFAIMEEGKIPLLLTGTTVGLISFIGYTPDVFMGPLMGYLLDRSPGALGHQHVFLVFAGFSFVGLIAAIWFRRITKSAGN